MDDFNDLFKSRRGKRNDSRYHKSVREKYNVFSSETKQEPPYRNRYEKRKSIIDQTPLDLHHHCKHNTRSTTSMPLHNTLSSEESSCFPKSLNREIIGKNVSSLPYYIVPVLYVPHKPLYEAKQAIQPKAYKAYHCRSKNRLYKESKLTKSKSRLNKKQGEYDYPFSHQKEKYSFESYDQYFKNCIEEKRSSSDISFYTEKSHCNLPLTPKMSSKFTEESFVSSSERRRSISKHFPELFGVGESKTTNFTLGPRVGDEAPTWDSPRMTNALIETEAALKSCMSAQTSFDGFNWRWEEKGSKTESQGTQTVIMDIKKNVLVMPNEKFGRSGRQTFVQEEVPKNIRDGNMLDATFSDCRLEKTKQKQFGFNRSNSRFTVSRLTKSAISSSYSMSKKSSKKSMDSGSTSLV